MNKPLQSMARARTGTELARARCRLQREEEQASTGMEEPPPLLRTTTMTMTTIGAGSASSSSSPVDAGEDVHSSNSARLSLPTSRQKDPCFPLSYSFRSSPLHAHSLLCLSTLLWSRKSRSNDPLHDFSFLFLSKSFPHSLPFSSFAVLPVSYLQLELT